jgi:Na+/H+ antiporter NhaD/arsenite permease-like protein
VLAWRSQYSSLVVIVIVFFSMLSSQYLNILMDFVTLIRQSLAFAEKQQQQQQQKRVTLAVLKHRI